MKAIPMIFNQQMVTALVDGRKTVTRRPMKLETKDCDFGCLLKPNEVAGEVNNDNFQNAPYNKGDLIWVRETFRQFNSSDECGCSDSPCGCPNNVTYIYKANGDSGESKWKPSIHMPRKANRLTLRVTGVRCERLSETDDKSAIKEGINCYQFYPDDGFPLCDGYTSLPDDGKCVLHTSAKEAYKHLWNSIYSNWDKNPWVWVIEFEVIEKNIDEVIKVQP